MSTMERVRYEHHGESPVMYRVEIWIASSLLLVHQRPDFHVCNCEQHLQAGREFLLALLQLLRRGSAQQGEEGSLLCERLDEKLYLFP